MMISFIQEYGGTRPNVKGFSSIAEAVEGYALLTWRPTIVKIEEPGKRERCMSVLDFLRLADANVAE